MDCKSCQGICSGSGASGKGSFSAHTKRISAASPLRPVRPKRWRKLATEGGDSN